MAPHPVYILEKKIINLMGAIRFTFLFANVNRMAPYPNRMRGIQFIWSSFSPMQIHRRWQPNHQINYPNHQYHSQIANKHNFFYFSLI